MRLPVKNAEQTVEAFWLANLTAPKCRQSLGKCDTKILVNPQADYEGYVEISWPAARKVSMFHVEHWLFIAAFQRFVPRGTKHRQLEISQNVSRGTN